MRQEPAVRLETSPTEPLAPNTAPPSVVEEECQQAEPTEEPPESRVRRVPSPNKIKEEITDILKAQDKDSIEEEVETLEAMESRSSKQEARLKTLRARLEHIERLEGQYKAAGRAARSQREFEELEEEDERDRCTLEQLKQKRAEAAERKNAAIAVRAERLKAQREAAEAAAKNGGGAGGGDEQGAGSALKREIGELSERIDEFQEDLETYQEEAAEVNRRIKKREAKMEALQGAAKKHLGTVLEIGTVAAGLKALSVGHERAYEEEVEKEEAASEEAARERVRAREEEEERRAKAPKPLGEQLKRVGKGSAKLTVGATAVVAGVGFLGAFGLAGNFFKTWARRMAHPHLFVDRLFKHFVQETAAPPKGKGAVLGTIGTAFWLIAGDAPLVPHDTYHHVPRVVYDEE